MLNIAWCILGLVCIYEIPSVVPFNPYFLRKETFRRGPTTVKDNEYPYMVAIYANPISPEKYIPHCLGIILNQYTILTSATCVHDRWGNRKVYPRSFVVRYDIREGCEFRGSYGARLVRNIVTHPLHDFSTRFADLAYMITYVPIIDKKVDRPTKHDLNAQNQTSKETVQLPEIVFETVASGVECKFFGFVSQKNSRRVYHRLNYAYVFLVQDSLCAHSYAREFGAFSRDKYCAGFPAKDVVPTLNDTGGPLICNDKIVAITSYTSVNGTLPGTYTRLVDYRDFIEEAFTAAKDLEVILQNSTQSSGGEKPNYECSAFLFKCTVFIVFICTRNDSI